MQAKRLQLPHDMCIACINPLLKPASPPSSCLRSLPFLVFHNRRVCLAAAHVGSLPAGRYLVDQAFFQLAVDPQGAVLAAGNQLLLLRLARCALPLPHVLFGEWPQCPTLVKQHRYATLLKKLLLWAIQKKACARRGVSYTNLSIFEEFLLFRATVESLRLSLVVIFQRC